MVSRGTFLLRPNGPYNFELSFSFYQRSRFELIDTAEAGCFARSFLVDDIPILIRIPRQKSGLIDRFRIEWQSPSDSVDRKRLRQLLARMFYTDFDIERFYSSRLDAVIRRLTRRYTGFRPILTPTVFESAAWAVIGQQVTLHFAHMIKSRLIRMIDRTFVLDGETYYLFPTADDIAGLDYSLLRSIQLSGRKAEYLLNFSQMVASGKLNLENVMASDYEAAYHELTAIRGIGPWTANYVLMRGAGHRDAFPIGDSGINRAVQVQYGLKSKPDIETLIELGERWRPYRSLASFYLWRSL